MIRVSERAFDVGPGRPGLHPVPSVRARAASGLFPVPGAAGARPHGPVPSISQLNGSPNQFENCGPTTMAMAARAYGLKPGLSDAALIDAAGAARGTGTYPGGGTPPRGMVAIGRWLDLRVLANADSSYDRVHRQLGNGFLVPLAGDFYALPQHRNPAKSVGHWTLLVEELPNGTFRMNDPADTRPGSRFLSWMELQAFLAGNDGKGTFAASMRVG